METSLFDAVSVLIGQSVRVQLQDGSATDGVLYCVDPETDHVALLYPSGESGYSIKIVMAPNVRAVEKGPQERADIPTLAFLKQELSGQNNSHDSLDDQASIERRREQLGQFLAKHFVSFDVAADGIHVFGGAALVPPPFLSVQCSNEQLLRRLQQLLTQFRNQQDEVASRS